MKYLPAQVVPAIVGFISIPIITRLFLPDDYGNYTLVLSTVSVLCTLSGWLSVSIIRFYPIYKKNEKLDELYGIIIKLLLISAIVLSFSYILIMFFCRDYYSEKLYQLMWIGILLVILFSIFDVLLNILRVQHQVNLYSTFSVWKSITSIIFGLIFVFIFHYGIEGLLWGSISSVFIVLPLIWKLAVRKPPVYKRIITKSTFEMVRYSFPLVFGNLAAWILSLSDRFFLGFFRSSQEVGIYSASYSISEYSILFLGSLFMLASGPMGINIWEKEGIEKSQEFASKTTRYYLMICFPVAVWMSVFSKPIISILTAPEYYEGYKIFFFVVFGGFLLGLQQRFQSGLLYYKKTLHIMLCIAGASILNLILNFIFVPKYGYMAAASSTLLGYMILLILMIMVSRRYFIWKFPSKSFAKIILSSTIMGITTYFVCINLTTSNLFNLTFSVCFSTVMYFSLLFLFKEIDEDEIAVLKNVGNKIEKNISNPKIS